MVNTKKTDEIVSKESKQKITCPCGNDSFRLSEHINGPFRSLHIECTKCGNAVSHGGGLTARDIIFIMKGPWYKEPEKYLEHGDTS